MAHILDINLRSIVRLVLEYFWRRIVRRAAGRCQASAILHHVAQAEVADFQILVRVEKQVLQLQVTVGDALAVTED